LHIYIQVKQYPWFHQILPKIWGAYHFNGPYIILIWLVISILLWIVWKRNEWHTFYKFQVIVVTFCILAGGEVICPQMYGYIVVIKGVSYSRRLVNLNVVFFSKCLIRCFWLKIDDWFWFWKYAIYKKRLGIMELMNTF